MQGDINFCNCEYGSPYTRDLKFSGRKNKTCLWNIMPLPALSGGAGHCWGFVCLGRVYNTSAKHKSNSSREIFKILSTRRITWTTNVINVILIPYSCLLQNLNDAAAQSPVEIDPKGRHCNSVLSNPPARTMNHM